MNRRLALALLFFLVASAARAACPESGGIGGTGIKRDGGIGGTGMRAQTDLGVVGVITGFGSICVNEVEIDYQSGTPVTSPDGPTSSAALALGQVVAVHAIGDTRRAAAQRIDILDGAVGAVEAFDRAAGVLHVAGQRVHVSPGTVFAGGVTREALAQGPVVRASGLWRADGTLQATRIEAAPPNASAHIGARDWPRLPVRVLIVEGYVRDARPDGVSVGGLQFERGGAGGQRELRSDDLVRITARVEDGRAVLERTDVLRGPSDARPDRSGNQGSGRAERNEGPGRAERTDAPARAEREAVPERVDRSGPGPSRPERPERPERSGSDRPERPERVDRSGRR